MKLFKLSTHTQLQIWHVKSLGRTEVGVSPEPRGLKPAWVTWRDTVSKQKKRKEEKTSPQVYMYKELILFNKYLLTKAQKLCP